jgi:hypothetical protein
MALTNCALHRGPVKGRRSATTSTSTATARSFAFAVDVAMLTLGGYLKKQGEPLGAARRRAVVHVHRLDGAQALREPGPHESDLPLVEWACRTCSTRRRNSCTASCATSRTAYEVALEPDADVLGEFEAWLEYHVDEMLALPGFTGASIHKAEDPESGAALRIVRYELADRAALERYFEEFAPRMRAEGIARFGGRFRASRRIVHEGRDAALTDARPCPNCNELLWGQYCASCGQRARVRMITFWELLKDAGDLLASLDSRIWRTLGLLMFRPGRLTLDYLQGKRARFVPPVRLFIASSIVFFFIATLNTRFDWGPDSAVVLDPGGAVEELDDAVSAPRQDAPRDLLLRLLEEAEREAAGPDADPEAGGGPRAGAPGDRGAGWRRRRGTR